MVIFLWNWLYFWFFALRSLISSCNQKFSHVSIHGCWFCRNSSLVCSSETHLWNQTFLVFWQQETSEMIFLSVLFVVESSFVTRSPPTFRLFLFHFFRKVLYQERRRRLYWNNNVQEKNWAAVKGAKCRQSSKERRLVSVLYTTYKERKES